MKFNNVDINWLGHASFKIKNFKVIYIDPFKIKQEEKADIILITHEHFDHLSLEDIGKIITKSTIIIASNQCKDLLSKLGSKVKEIIYANPDEIIDLYGIKIEIVPAYNVNKFRSPGNPFHPKPDKKLGYVLTINNVRIYHAGDTDLIPEMNNLKNIDIALLPISGTYVMDFKEAAEAVKIIRPKMAVPMHVGSIIGTTKDMQEFKELASNYCKVEIL